MDKNVKEYKFQITIDSLAFKYETANDYKQPPTVYIIGDVIHDGYARKCDVILPGMQQRFEKIIAELYLNGFTGDTTESHFKAITILFDEVREAQSGNDVL